ncbi:MAG: hypothetical protein IT518_15745 [Burkholderiales bacterium]|nr:hypothetical protein [Burkholderiales bacterium]
MPKPPQVQVAVGPSRAVGAAIGVATLATLCLVLTLPLPAWLHGAMCALLLAWAWIVFQVVALRRGPYAVTEVRLAPDLVLVVRRGDERLAAGHVRSSTFVAAWLTCIVWRPDGARVSRAILIAPDMLPAGDFRRLRVMLRYARSGEMQEAPLSHS